MEIMGREFRTIENGLDPDEVIAFLKAATGSSEDAFHRLEQFSALQAAAKTMDESISQAKRLAEYAKKQAESEAKQERERVLEEAKEQAQGMVEQVKNSCALLIDDVRSVMADTIYTAFEKAKETIDNSLAGLDADIDQVGVSHHDQIRANHQQSDDTLSDPPADTEEAATPDEDEVEEEEDEDGGTDLADLQKSLANLENSLSSLHVNKGAEGDTSKHQSSEEAAQNIENRDELPAEARGNNDKQDDNDCQYSGDVAVSIPGGASESWMQELRGRVFKVPGARIKSESGLEDNTTVVTLSLSEPTALRAVLQEMPKVVKVMDEQDNGESSDKGPMKLLHKASKKLRQPTITVELEASASVPVLM
jgi:F0F1-type ATP synthase membrane subunit b/b'